MRQVVADRRPRRRSGWLSKPVAAVAEAVVDRRRLGGRLSIEGVCDFEDGCRSGSRRRRGRWLLMPVAARWVAVAVRRGVVEADRGAAGGCRRRGGGVVLVDEYSSTFTEGADEKN